MMVLETTPWDTAEYLKTPADVAGYLEAVFEDGDPELIKHALGVVARAKGMTKVAKATGLTREALYKALKADGDPKLSTFFAVMRALDMRIVAKPAETENAGKRPARRKPSREETSSSAAERKPSHRKKAA
jgi:probable addiction module antidote protein